MLYNYPVKFHATWRQRLWLRTYLYLARNTNSVRDRLIRALKTLRSGLANESEETKQMVKIYYLQSQGRATPEQVGFANRQFRELLRSLGLGVLVILPFSPITLPLVVKLGRKLGVEVLPESLRDVWR